MSEYGVFSGTYFPAFGLNMKIYYVNLRIQSEYRKIRTRKNSLLGHFSRSENSSITKEWKYRSREFLKATFLSPKKGDRLCLNFFQPQYKCTAGASTPYLEINAPSFYCPLYFQRISHHPSQDKPNDKRRQCLL